MNEKPQKQPKTTNSTSEKPEFLKTQSNKPNKQNGYYKPIPYPIKAKKTITITETETGQKVQTITHEQPHLYERRDLIRNPNLTLLIDSKRCKVYMRNDEGSTWLMAYDEEDNSIWIPVKGKFAEQLEALLINIHRNFANPPPCHQIRIKKAVREEMIKQLIKLHGSYHEKECRQKCRQNTMKKSNSELVERRIRNAIQVNLSTMPTTIHN